MPLISDQHRDVQTLLISINFPLQQISIQLKSLKSFYASSFSTTIQKNLKPPMAPYSHLASGQGGHWSLTATIDWCESNYEFSYYIAEFWNTLSNLAFVVPQIAQYIALSRYKSVELPFRLAFLSLALVGIGSFCFHMTLSKTMQMFDETSMILVSLHGFYLLYIISKPNANKRLLVAVLICYGLVFLALYLFLVAWPIFHHTAFGLLVYASIFIGYKLKKYYSPHYKFWTVLTLQHLAFAFWLFDKHYCDLLTAFRENHVPAFLRPAFQFHALWHLLMGLASHIFICGLIRLRAWTKYREEFVIVYKWFGLWVVLEKLKTIDCRLDKQEKENRSKRLDVFREVKVRKQLVSHTDVNFNNDNFNNNIIEHRHTRQSKVL